MQAILFCGIQATGKSSFYKERFFNTHVRISLDLLNTRNKERQLLEWCLRMQAPFVVDNTNPSKVDRATYIRLAKENKFQVVGYYFQSKLEQSLERNAQREGKARISDVGVRSTYRQLQLPSMDEGFDELHFVQLENGLFVTQPWKDEV